MTFLPIVTRELRVASRRRGTYWLRSGAGLAVIAVGTWLFFMVQDRPPREVGRVLFYVMTGIAVLSSLLSGMRFTADCLSEEKRDGTLGLLFLTDLKGYDVVLGKLVARSLNAFYGVLAVLPMLAIPLLLGGITAGEYVRIACVAVNTLLLSLSVGMCVSSFTRSPQKAVGLTLAVILLLTAGLPALGGILAAAKAPRLAPWLFFVSPGYSYFLALESSVTPFTAGTTAFWVSVVVLAVFTVLFLVLASIIAPRSWQDRPDAPTIAWRDRWRLWIYGASAERLAFRRKLLDQNAFFWLTSRVRFRPAGIWLFLTVIAALWVWGLIKLRREWLNVGIYVVTTLLLNSVVKCWFAGEASRQIAEERKAGTLELLLSTPLSVRDILAGQVLALMRHFAGPVLVLLLTECLFIIAPLPDLTSEDRALWAAFLIGSMVMLVGDLVAFHWVGMWQGLTARNPARAASNSVLAILCAPWLVFALVILVIALMALTGTPEKEPGPRFFLGLWLVQGLGADLVFGLYARHKLLTEFRMAAQERYGTQPGFWQRVSGR